MVPLRRRETAFVDQAPLSSAGLHGGFFRKQGRQKGRAGFTVMFAHPFLAPLALVPLIWAALSWPRSRSRAGLVLKAISFSAILLAFSEPSINLPRTRTATAVLVDT